MLRIILFSIVCLFLTSCNDDILGPSLNFQYVEIYLDTNHDELVMYQEENGMYHLEYEANAVYRVHYNTTPNNRVFWHSPDDFYTEWMGQNYAYPIINYSTYADGWGEGIQLFYIDNTMIGDTLSIIGYLDYLIWDGLMFVVEDNQ